MKGLNYAGDVVSDVVGLILGPDDSGRFYVVTDANYDPATDNTAAATEQIAYTDGFGQLRAKSW